MAHFLKDNEQMRSASHGRGGAGNINSKPTASGLTASDLETPTLKGQNYTTGRGGTGNIVSNDDPVAARTAQDVDAPAYHSKEPKGTYHWGRGGQGNMTTLGGKGADKEVRKEEEERSRSKQRAGSKGQEGQRRPSFQGKVKEMLGFGKKGERGEDNAVEEEK